MQHINQFLYINTPIKKTPTLNYVWEIQMLEAFKKEDSKGKRDPEKEEIKGVDPFLQDYYKILQTKGFRRLFYKTQAVSLPDNPHFRTRGIHTMEVVSLSTIISHKLKLNIPLCQAIAVGHDVGHVPYGHDGEKVLTKLSGQRFQHNVNSVIIPQEIEGKCKGINLSYETLEGILMHSRGGKEMHTADNKPCEYATVMYADKIAYTFSDVNDAIRHGYFEKDDLPEYILELGYNQRTRTNRCVNALVKESEEKVKLEFKDSEEAKLFKKTRDFMYEKYYRKIDMKLQEYIIEKAFDYLSNNKKFEEYDPILLLALMTDRELNQLSFSMLKNKKINIQDFEEFGVNEIMPYIKNKKIDFEDPKLEWA